RDLQAGGGEVGTEPGLELRPALRPGHQVDRPEVGQQVAAQLHPDEPGHEFGQPFRGDGGREPRERRALPGPHGEVDAPAEDTPPHARHRLQRREHRCTAGHRPRGRRRGQRARADRRGPPAPADVATSATPGGAASPRAPLIRTRSDPSCARRTESSRNTTSGAAYRAPATPSRSWSVTVPTVTAPNADGWRVTTAEPSAAISAIGYPPVTGSVVRVTSVEASTTPVAPGPPDRTCPTATEPASASRAEPVHP